MLRGSQTGMGLNTGTLEFIQNYVYPNTFVLGYLIVLFPCFVFNHDLHNACYLWHLNYKPQAANRSEDKIEAWRAGVQRETETDAHRQTQWTRELHRDAELLISLRLIQSDRKATTERERKRNTEV